MAGDNTQRWLEALGYEAGKAEIYRRASDVSRDHPYQREIGSLLARRGSLRPTAIVAMDDVPTVCFVDAAGALDESALDAIRHQIWNQNLVSLVLVVDGTQLRPYPIHRGVEPAAPLGLKDASPRGPYSVADVRSGDVQERLPAWFSLESRVDRDLLHNLRHAVRRIAPVDRDGKPTTEVTPDDAQILLGRCLFVSYLEHREIIGEAYRVKHRVGRLRDLIAAGDRTGLEQLFEQLRTDFNGDFLRAEAGDGPEWTEVTDRVLHLVADFLGRVDMESGQQALWNYDFRHIPVELISGIYETFLGSDKSAKGAFYTPRHLADLVVDEAFGDLDPADQRILDPACGSGILLTAGFRRILGCTEQRRKRPLDFAERCDLLLDRVRGGDISEAACRVTAFSLYLSLLEDLKPSDITLLQDDAKVKLPHLLRKTIMVGDAKGDWFGAQTPYKGLSDCTIIVSNPPWYEPDRGAVLPYEQWASDAGHFLPRRQIAAAFAHKAADVVPPTGRVAMVLPASLFTAPTSEKFVSQWLMRFRLERLINFSDVRRLMFSDAIHPCVVAIGSPREESARKRLPLGDLIDYWVPKTDVSLAFGRLTIHSNDRHRLLLQDVLDDTQYLRTYIWGAADDGALIERLRGLGRVADLVRGPRAPLWLGKGFNVARKGSEDLPSTRLHGYKFLAARRMPKDEFVLERGLLEAFPADEIPTVVSYGSDDGRAFKGPRVLFADGASADFEPGALFTDVPCCFKHTVAALVGGKQHADMLRFLTVYLHSKLARYMLLHTSYSLAAERPRITLKDVEQLPFVQPKDHSNRERAEQIVSEIADQLRAWEHGDEFKRIGSKRSAVKDRFEALVYEYFGLSERDRTLVEDTCNIAIPSVQPADDTHIRTPLLARPERSDFSGYESRLLAELTHWKSVLGGEGAFAVRALAPEQPSYGAVGAVRIDVNGAGSEPHNVRAESSVNALIEWLQERDLLPMQVRGDLSLASDYLVHAGESMYLIKPMTKRMWLRSQALRDVARIVESVGSPARAP